MAIKIGGTTIIDDSRVLINTGNVGVGTTNPNSVVSGSNTSIVHAGIVTARELYGDGSNLTDIEFATTAGIATYTSEWILETGNGSDYGISGPGLTGTENDPTFYLTRGEQYKFINNTGGHPFRIQSTPNGSVGTQYSDGITNNNAGNGTTLLWNVQFDSPDILYYQCITGGHGGMGGKIYIVNAGIASDVNLFTTGISTLGGVEISAGIVTATSGIVTYYGDGSKLSNLPSTGGEDDDWIRTSAGIHTVASNVGIGTTNPTENLEVRGNIRIEEGDLLVGTGRTFVVATSTGTTSYISARSGIITTSEQTIIVPPVNNANNFDNDELPGNDIDIIGSFTSGDTTFTTTNADSDGINDVLTDPDYTGPSIDSGRYFLVPTNNQSAQLFGGSNRILSFDFGTNTFTVESPALISDNNVGTQEYEFEMVYGDPILPAGEYNFVGIGTDNPLYPLHVAPPLQITNSSYPALFVDGNAYIKGRFLKIGDFSITLDASVDGAEKLHFSRGNNIGIHSQSGNSIAVSGSLAAESVIETVGIDTHNIVSLNVTVGVKTTGDIYLGAGSTEKFLIEGNKTPYLHLTAGRTYRFNQEDASNVNHTLKFYTDLAQTSEVSGVTTVGTAGSEGAYTQLAVHSVNTPSRIFYGSISTSHVGNMTMVEATNNNLTSGIVSFTNISVGSSVTAGTYYGDGQYLQNISSGGGFSVTNDTSTNSTYYPVFVDTTSGDPTQTSVSSTKLNFNPSTGNFSATQFTSLSDVTKKTNIRPVENALEITKQLEGVRFDWIDNNKPSIGLIAQQVEEVLPELVETSDDGIKSVSYGNIIGVLVEAIKEQQKLIDKLMEK